jgi:hypothetical protein
LESNVGFDQWVSPECSFVEAHVRAVRLLGCLLECGLFKPEKGEANMWMQRLVCYTTVVGTNLLAKIHHLYLAIEGVALTQNHPLDKLAKCINFVGNHSNHISRKVDSLHKCIDEQDIQIDQLSTIVTLGARGDVLTQYIVSTLLVLGQ